jgi:hypothetical protein
VLIFFGCKVNYQKTINKQVQVGFTTYERRQKIEGVEFHIWNGSEENYSRQLRKDH